MKRGTYHTGFVARPATPAVTPARPPAIGPAPIGYQPAGSNGYGFASIFDYRSNQSFALETSNIDAADDGNPLNSPFGFEPTDLTLGPLNQAPTYGTAFPTSQSGDGSASSAIPGATGYKPRSAKRAAMDKTAAALAGPAAGARSAKRIAQDGLAKSGFSKLSSTQKILLIGGGAVALFAYLAYRRVTAPLRYAHRIGRAVKGVHNAITG